MKLLFAPYRWRRAVVGPAIGGAGLWLAAILVILAVYFSPAQLMSPQTVVLGLLGFGVLAIAMRWPDRALIALIVVLPFQGFILAKLWAWGLPTSVVRYSSAWKEALALGVVLAGVKNYLASGRRADLVDRLGLGFVGIIVLYVLVQKAFVPSASSTTSVHWFAFRQEAGFVLLLLGARHASLPKDFLDRAGRAAIAVAVVVAGVCVFESLDSSAWNNFVVNDIQYTRYQLGVLHGTPVNPFDIRIYGNVAGAHLIRTGSVFLSALTCGFYLVIGFALAVERAARGGPRRRVTMLTLVLVGAGILLTQTRSAILAALIVALIAFWPAAGRTRHWRTQLAILVAALAIVAVPAAVGTGFSKRVTSPSTSSDNAGHVSSFRRGMHTIEHHPLGTGLGTSAGVGQQYSRDAAVVVPENNYLQVGDELGIPAALLFVLLTVALLVKLRRLSRQRPEALVTAAWAGGAGLALAAWFLQTWSDFAVSWTYWGLAGAALGVAGQRAVEAVGTRSQSVNGPAERPGQSGMPEPAATVLSSASR